MGIEPTNRGTTNPRLNHLATLAARFLRTIHHNTIYSSWDSFRVKLGCQRVGGDMKDWQIVLLSALAVAGLGGVMVLTNPERSAYEEYAVEQLGNQARAKCDLAPAGLGIFLQQPCRAAIESAKPQIRVLVKASSNRQNLGLFSIYRSDLSIPVLNLGVKVESVGIFGRFFTYRMG